MRNIAIRAGFVLLLAGLQTAAAAAAEPPSTQPPALAAAAYAQGQQHLAATRR
jgi:hypothetical protein